MLWLALAVLAAAAGLLVALPFLRTRAPQGDVQTVEPEPSEPLPSRPRDLRPSERHDHHGQSRKAG